MPETNNQPAPVVDTSTSQAPPAATPAAQSVNPAPLSVTPGAQSATAPAEVLYQPEAELPVAPSAADIAHLRGLDKDGAPLICTPDQIADLVPYVGENLLKGATSVSVETITNVRLAGYCIISEDIVIGDTYVASITSYEGCTPTGCVLYCDDLADSLEVTLGKPFILPKKFSNFRIRIAEETGTATIRELKLERGAKATPYIPNSADIAHAIDYSLLTEQIVSGEYWLNFAGVKIQVYTRTFVLKNVQIKEEVGISRVAVKLWSGSPVKEVIALNGVLDLGQTKTFRYIQGIEGVFVNVNSIGGEVNFIFRGITLGDVGKLFDAIITIKYIK